MRPEEKITETNYAYFLSDTNVVRIITAIFVSTIAMATLEPCLPIWLMATLKPEVCFLFFFTIFSKNSSNYFILPFFVFLM